MERRALLFVCLGNICRSPVAEAAARQWARTHGLDLGLNLGLNLAVGSRGTGPWHQGRPADAAMGQAAAAIGLDLSAHRARQLDLADFYEADHILTMDGRNYEDVLDLAPPNRRARIAPFDIPDPYGGTADRFHEVATMIAARMNDLLPEILGE